MAGEGGTERRGVARYRESDDVVRREELQRGGKIERQIAERQACMR